MPKHVSTVARSELVRASVITRSHSVEASSRFSVHLSPGLRLRTTFRTTTEKTSAALQRSLVGQNDRAKRCKSAAAAEPIAFARTDIAEPEEEDFYSILGVSYNANEAQIKKAYYAIMRECHPDLSQDEESLEFSTVINEIYETLKHSDRRAAYDAIVGISGDAINPFTDTSYERDQVFVDELTCIGCCNCTNVCPNTYQMEPDFGRARAMAQKVDNDEMLQESLDCCPVDCIHWVTAPQLSLLENSMSKLERTNVHLLNTHGGNRGGVNVFLEASIAWEKRQAGIRAKRHVAESQARWAKWGAATGVATGHAAKAGQEETGPVPRGSAADTASAAARAARRWRDLQRMKRNNADRLMISSVDD